MLRRNARLRREYLYRKSLEGKERATYEKKRKIKDALAGLFVALVRFSMLTVRDPSDSRLLQRASQFQLS